MNFCAAILILKKKDEMSHFQCIMLYYFKKGKNATETHTHTRSVQCVEKVLCLIKCVKVIREVSWYYWHFGQIISWYGAVLCIGRCLAAPTRSQYWEKANTLKISKSIKLLVKMKNVYLILWRKHNGFFGQSNNLFGLHLRMAPLFPLLFPITFICILLIDFLLIFFYYCFILLLSFLYIHELSLLLHPSKYLLELELRHLEYSFLYKI